MCMKKWRVNGLRRAMSEQEVEDMSRFMKIRVGNERQQSDPKKSGTKTSELSDDSTISD